MSPQEEIKELKQRLADLEWRLSFDPEKEYDFQEVLKLTIENPGWKFKRADSKCRVIFHPSGNDGDYYRWVYPTDEDYFKLTFSDFTNKWKRVK